MSFSLPVFGSAVQIDTSSWAGSTSYFDDWRHHSGKFFEDPINPVYFPLRDNPAVEFEVPRVLSQDYALATNTQQLWDTALLGPVASVRFVLQGRLYESDGAAVQIGALVWNSTTNQFFLALTNGLTADFELSDRTLSPSADFCLLGPGGVCTPISGFGDGILQFGYAARADMTNELGSRVMLEFDGNDSFLFRATNAPEPTTMVLAGVGLIACGIWRRKRTAS